MEIFRQGTAYGLWNYWRSQRVSGTSALILPKSKILLGRANLMPYLQHLAVYRDPLIIVDAVRFVCC
jgi:hypothetical protein